MHETTKKSPKQKVFSDPVLRSVVIAVAAAQFLLPFMMAGLTPLLPAIGKDLNAGAMELGLVGAVYALSLAIFHLVSARVGDMIGRRKLFLTGLGIFLVVAVAIPFSPNMPVFLVFRFIQATGTAMMNTCALSILIACAPEHMRGRVLGVASIGLFAGISCGPTVGGFIATYFSWHWIFLCVVPVGVVAFLLMALTVKQDWTDHPEAPFDWAGAVLFALGMGSLCFGATFLLEGLWAKVLLGLGVVFLFLFVRAERRAQMPILDVDFVVHNTSFAGNMLVSLLNYTTTMGMIFYFSLYLQFMLGLDMSHTGMVLTAQPFMQLTLAPFGGRAADRFGPTRVAAVGLLLCGVALTLSSLMADSAEVWYVIMILLFNGAGLALFGAPNTSAIMASVDKQHLGQASGVVGTVRTMGMLASMVLVSLTMNIFLGLDPVHSGNVGQFMLALRADFLLFNILNGLAIVLCLWLVRYDTLKKKRL